VRSEAFNEFKSPPFWFFEKILKKVLKFQKMIPILRMNTDHLPPGNVQKESPE
jgi:hypothetical protein